MNRSQKRAIVKLAQNNHMAKIKANRIEAEGNIPYEVKRRITMAMFALIVIMISMSFL